MPRLLACTAVMFTLLGSAPMWAQQSRVPTAGTQMPAITLFDEDGNEFSTESLKGKHSVVVFGCLT